MKLLNEGPVVSDQQVADYRANGWARIPGLIPVEQALELKARLELLRARSEELTPDPERIRSRGQKHIGAEPSRRQHVMYENPGDYDHLFHAVTYSRRMGETAARFLEAESVRYLRSTIFEKVAESAGNAATNLHQDFPYLPVDRSGTITIWLALCEVAPDMGPLQFVSGSHTFGSLGRDAQTNVRPDFVAQQYARHAWPLTDPSAMKPGDATIHADLTIHGAARNTTDRPRTGFAMTYMRSDVLYTGAPWRHTDALGLEPNKPFDHEMFPILT
ncbi:hypothetical protein GCM10009555_005730 [Acrocarpospora macrocephala]|uniref:Phytanoyl-CoA dioxygenase n=1 Tax=Acrocarpospora macrocephala TaxID=150177 RepID=A0A5M3X272_9ACTN|nr:phytanoyl-CoA dioxygenase family protein [Acrocarpospora macrocephala]GES14766.1 hypothetical protein Amac_083630 [Acrocarpospora macrocephala]